MDAHPLIHGHHPDRIVIIATIDDAEHFTAEERQRIIDSYPAHERDARTKGIPTMGSGKVFPVVESDIVIDPVAIAKHWKQINGLDFGWDHPFAACNIAWDADADIIYITREYRQKEAIPVIHAASVKPWGDWVPCAWPHDGFQHDKGSGDQLAETYRKQGLKMTEEHATHPEGGNGVEAGILDMLERMQTGRLKVFKTCTLWLEEFRLYHRVNGKIVKERDDLMSASRYAIMMLRFATVQPIARGPSRPARIGMVA